MKKIIAALTLTALLVAGVVTTTVHFESKTETVASGGLISPNITDPGGGGA